jgi:hypothetical protein
MNFSELRTTLEIFLKIQVSDYEFLDHGLITKKSRDLSTRFWEISAIKNIFRKTNPVDSIHGL